MSLKKVENVYKAVVKKSLDPGPMKWDGTISLISCSRKLSWRKKRQKSRPAPHPCLSLHLFLFHRPFIDVMFSTRSLFIFFALPLQAEQFGILVSELHWDILCNSKDKIDSRVHGRATFISAAAVFILGHEANLAGMAIPRSKYLHMYHIYSI